MTTKNFHIIDPSITRGYSIMLKKTNFYFVIMTCTIILTLSENSYCQESSNGKHSLNGGFFNSVGIINETPTLMPGIKIGWSYRSNRNYLLKISPFVTKLVNKVDVQKNNYGDTLFLDLTFIGLNINYSKWEWRDLSLSVMSDIGIGIANEHFGDFDSDIESGYLVYSIRPGILFSKEIVNIVTISGGLSYNVTAGSKYFIVSSQKLSGIQLNTVISIRIPI